MLNMAFSWMQDRRPWLWLLLATSVGCVPRHENEVVLYSSTDRQFATPILDAFERQPSAITVARQFDVETTKTLGLVNRILEEKTAPRCDVYWSGEILHTIRLQQAGLLKKRNWHRPVEWPSNYSAQDGTWTCMGARGRILLINHERLADRTTWPQRVEELADPRWKGQCGLAKPFYGTTATHMTVLSTSERTSPCTGDQFQAWIQRVAANAAVLGGNKQVAQAVASGELAWGITDTDDAQIELENGHPVTIIYPDQADGELGCLLIPGTVAVIKGGPNPVAAELLADFLASEANERRLVLGNASQFALWPKNQSSSRKRIDELKLFVVDFEKAAKDWEGVLEYLRKTFP